MVMRRLVIGLIIVLLFFSSLTLGCFEDSGGKKKNKAPIADAGSDFEVLTMTEVQFDGSNSSDPDGKIVSYEWDFSDHKNPGQDTSTDMLPEYTYNYPGQYEVTLTVTDDDGKSVTVSIIVTVLNRKPEVETGGDITAKVFEIVYFNVTAYDFDGYIRSLEWDFDGDGNYDWYAATIGSTTHFYETPGTYKAELSVTDNSEAVTIVIRNITIIEVVQLPPIADAGLNQTIPVGQVLLKGTGFDPDGNIVLYQWDFDGDGDYDWSSSSSGITKHDYSTEGEYISKLLVTDDSGLTASDVVTIAVNNSYAAHNVGAEIFINWSDTYNYLMVLNNTINESQLKVIISDIVTGTDEESDISDMIKLDETKFKVTSGLIPRPGSALQVQVLYYDTLIGARVIDIVNQSYEFISPELDFEAAFDLDQEIEEHDRGETEIIRIGSIGELKIEHREDLYYTSLHGTGEYYAKDITDEGEAKTTLICTDLWINNTLSGSEIVSESFSILGYGSMVMEYDNGMTMDLDIKKMVVITENDVDIVNYLYAEGTFSGTMDDPSSGITLEFSGDVYLLSELIGHGYHDNWAGDEYPCNIFHNNVTFDGSTGLPGGGPSTSLVITTDNITWNTNYEKYNNNTIYYEYTMTNTVANVEYYDSGSGYPENSPTTREPQVHISDVLVFDTPRPRILQGDDLLVIESKHGVELQLSVIGDADTKIENVNYDCVDLRGTFITGAEGSIKIRMIKTGDFTGMTVSNVEDIQWNDEWYKSEVRLKYIRT